MHIDTSPSSPRTKRIRSDERPRGCMKSITVTFPVAVQNVVSSTSVPRR
jgi:hypothetical protein